jgi:hypothetical protein
MISSSKHTPPAKPRNLPADRPTGTLPVSTICPSVIPVIVTRRHSVNRSSSVIPAQAGNQQTRYPKRNRRNQAKEGSRKAAKTQRPLPLPLCVLAPLREI